MKKIVIDPGHAPGNANRGKNGYYEYSGMWKLSNYLKEILEELGCVVNFTRAEHEDPTLSKRGEKGYGSDLFISQHSNAANGNARGVEVYYSVANRGDKEFAGAISKAISNVMGNQDRGAKTRASTTDPNTDYYTVMETARKAGARHVLLVENGFHDNVQDEEFLLKDDNLKEIAKEQAKVICDFLGVEMPDNKCTVNFDLFGKKRVEINGMIIDGVTHVQARHLLETMGLTVNWDDSTKTVLVSGSLIK